MRKLIYIIFVGSIVISITSCDSKKDPTPSDSVLEDFKNKLVGSWKILGTSVRYPASNGEATMAINDAADCTKELQWDYVKTFTISSDLKVTNEYYCSNPRVTYFELLRERNVAITDTFFIIEKDESGHMIKIYRVLETTSPTQFDLDSDIFDRSYFYPNKVGSIPNTPTGYTIAILKQ